ncbi:hypothetical protein GI374_02255 [Paracoccus sp. S-4012]|uniref:hypothetical protein n=1 Tax=Paracoccus sp. S-4012 TaxID=2665648 RepID=UPI0012AF7280|nr:hypothetical protein [Paracoccus sp. S-4012]MRX49282.1 hypothetical protein [Paracoccus sp. S-4012]
METAARLIVLGLGEGRRYVMGAVRAVLKADPAEVGERFSIPDRWLEPMGEGPGAYEHDAIAAWFRGHPPSDIAGGAR